MTCRKSGHKLILQWLWFVCSFSFQTTNGALAQPSPAVRFQFWKSCDKLNLTLEATGAETSRPLFVTNWTLHNLTINQTSHTPCSPNTILIEFKPSLALKQGCNPTITIEGLQGLSTTSLDPTSSSLDPVSIAENGVVRPGAISVTSWDRVEGILVLSVLKGLDPVVHTIALAVTNQACGRQATVATITVATSRCGAVARRGPLGSILGLVSRQFNAGVSIRQSTPHPCAANLIEVSFSTDYPLFPACDSRITVSGLTGSLTNDTGALTLQFSDGENSDTNAAGAWTRETGVLIFVVPNTTEAHRDYTVSLTLDNPTTKSEPCPTVTISHECDAADTNAQDIEVITQLPAYQTLKNATVEDYKPLCVRTPAICGSIVQSNPFVCSQTVVSVTLTAAVPLKTSCLENKALTISGLTNMLSTFTDFNASIAGTSATWNQVAGALTVTLGGDMHAELVLSWSLVHNKTVESTRAVAITGKAVSAAAPADVVALTCALGSLSMRPVTWTINLTQSPPLACTVNRVEICISTNIPLVNVVPSNVPGCTAGDSVCNGWCRYQYMLAGLTNMTTVDSLGLTVKEGQEGLNVTDLTAGAATFESSGMWNREAGEFTVYYRGDTVANTSYCFRILLVIPLYVHDTLQHTGHESHCNMALQHAAPCCIHNHVYIAHFSMYLYTSILQHVFVYKYLP